MVLTTAVQAGRRRVVGASAWGPRSVFPRCGIGSARIMSVTLLVYSAGWNHATGSMLANTARCRGEISACLTSLWNHCAVCYPNA